MSTCGSLSGRGTLGTRGVSRVRRPPVESRIFPGCRSKSALYCARSEEEALEATTVEARRTDGVDGEKSSVGRSSLFGSLLSCGVKNATARFDLPPPQVAVRNLAEQAQFAHLCTIMSSMHHRRAGYPFGTLVDFITDGGGFPVFSLSPLALPSKNLQEDSRCSLVVQMPGWTGLANARVTIFGDVYPLPPSMHNEARELFHMRHTKRENVSTGNNLYFRMHKINDIYFVGGFGTVQWIDVADYLKAEPDLIVQANPHHTLHVLNETFQDDLKNLFSSKEQVVDDAAFISIDAMGADIRLRSGADFGVVRLGFDMRVHNLLEATEAVTILVNRP
ncbi:hypothetical protein BSKO_00251 [Bryopsis sp. KO-2023]|nr:hypothetical protein BSKO_00251 [Bryopsis sp. KO-2023]